LPSVAFFFSAGVSFLLRRRWRLHSRMSARKLPLG
jgi:hypothetical protein